MSDRTIYVIVVGLYVAGLATLAWVESRRVKSASDFIIAGGKLGSAVSGVSEIFSAYSGFWLIGVTGFAYTAGSWAWIALPSQAFGWVLAYYGQAERLKRSSSIIGEETIPAYLGTRWNSRAVVGLGALFVTGFYGVYVGAQTSAGAKALVPFFEIDYFWAAIGMGLVIVLYTMTGGFLAVAWSDFLQGLLVAVGSTAMAIWAVVKVGGVGELFAELASIDPLLVSMTNGATGLALLGGVLLWFLIGLGYFGNPHVLSRFLAIDSSKSVRKAMFWSGGAQLVVTSTSIFIGLSARLLLPEITNTELAFPTLATQEFPALFGGVVLVSALGLIMSTADSQLLISGTAVSRDFIERTLGRDLTDRQSELVARAAVGAVGIFGIWVAALEVELVLWLIAFGWTALGATFGPALLASLWWKRATKEGVLASMVAGGAGAVVAHQWMTLEHSEWFVAWNLWPFVASVLALVAGSLLTDPSPEHADHLERLASGERNVEEGAGDR